MITKNTLFGVETITETKVCMKCNTEKPIVEFTNRTRDKDGNPKEYRNDCKACMKAESDVVKRLRKAFPPPKDHSCPICSRTQEDLTTFNGKGFVLDHDHSTGEFRGYICQYCNTGLSRFNDDPEILKNAIKYLTPA